MILCYTIVQDVKYFYALLKVRRSAWYTSISLYLSRQLYFVLQSKCRDLMCPFGKYPHYGNCEHKFSGLKSTCLCVELSINILLDYDIQQLNSSATSDVLDNMKNEIVNHILDLVNRINPGCNRKQVFNTKLSIDGTAPTLNVSLRVKLGPRCDVYNVTDMVIDLTGKTTLERLNNNTVDISLYLDKCNEAFPVDLDCRVTLRLDNNMTCSHIELFLSDVDEFSHKQQMERAVFLTFFDRTMALSKTTAVNVCVENYLKQMIIASGGCSISDELKIFVLFSMLSNCLITLSMYM